MPNPSPDDDATVVVQRSRPGSNPPPPPKRGAPRGLIAAALVVVALAAGGGWLLLRGSPAPPPAALAVTGSPAGPTPAPAPAAEPPTPPPTPASAPAAEPPPAPAKLAALSPAPTAPAPAAPIAAPPIATLPVFELKTATEAEIVVHSAADLAVFRFAPAPSIVVLDFPALQDQGLTLNRVAALVEKAGQPHDRVLNDAELDAAVKAHGDTTASYYYGHDYTAAELVRFFALADKGGIKLLPQEERLRALLRQLGWLTAAKPEGALISLSRAGADADITPAARATILHHELSHGAFFTEPRFAAYVRNFWKTALTAKEREALKHFLAADGYEPSDEDLTVNEMQAYLMFTHDHEFFDIAGVGLTAARRTQLEAAFRHGMPDGWVKAMPPSLAPIIPPAPAAISAACGSAQSCR